MMSFALEVHIYFFVLQGEAFHIAPFGGFGVETSMLDVWRGVIISMRLDQTSKKKKKKIQSLEFSHIELAISRL